MIATGPSAVVGAIGPTGFALMAWGSILVVGVAFVYIAWTVLADRRET